jgi:cytochrome c553
MSGHTRHMTAINRGQETPKVRGNSQRHSAFSRLSQLAVLASLMALPFVWAPRAALADSVEDAAQVCSGCHGEKGVPMDKTIPVIWGQRREYILKQLLDFKTGHRKNETMAAIVDSLTKQDMEALASYFSKQTWPNLGQSPAPADVQAKAWETIGRLNCQGCHQDYFQGDYVRPSLRGQQEEYLLKTMTDFHTGERSNYAAMEALMKSLNEDEMKPIATYLAGLSPQIPPIGQK